MREAGGPIDTTGHEAAQLVANLDDAFPLADARSQKNGDASQLVEYAPSDARSHHISPSLLC